MGLMDRDYWKEKHKHNHDYAENSLSTENLTQDKFLRQKKTQSILKLLINLISLAVITSILILTMRASDRNNSLYITSKVCQTKEVVIDANADGVFTYKDVGLITLNLFELPLKLLLTAPQLKAELNFLELKPSDCISYFAMVINEIIWILIFTLVLLFFYSCKFITKLCLHKFLFKILKISPFTKFGQTIFKKTYPHFEFDSHMNLILYFVVGIGVIFFLKTHYELFHSNSRPINLPTEIPEIIIRK